MEPSYIKLSESGKLKEISNTLYDSLSNCRLCPQNCGADRIAGEKGRCRSGVQPLVSSFHAHFGEEACLVGRNGSGTIFFANCNLSCIFCQNYHISQLGKGDTISCDELAKIMLNLQGKGCHNINFVSPTHFIYPIVKALETAVPQGLNIPLVYNSGGYDSAETLRLLEGVFDIYMPDFKYMDAERGEELSGARDYPQAAMGALREMHRQVGDLKLTRRGVAYRGILVRHLVLPNNLAATDRVMSFLASLSRDTCVNVMDQYRPEYRARECFDLKRRITLDEYDRAVKTTREAGLHRLHSKEEGLKFFF
jgi:putative pyruvate formate lyase activating enzyme